MDVYEAISTHRDGGQGQYDVIPQGCVGNQVQSDSIFLNTMHNNLHYGRDWTTGLDFWTHPNCKIHLVKCRTEAKHTYSLRYFANTAPYSIFPGVSRGQKSCAYLISLTFGGYA